VDVIKQDSCCQKGVLLAGIEVNQIGFSKKGVGCGCYMIVGCYIHFFYWRIMHKFFQGIYSSVSCKQFIEKTSHCQICVVFLHCPGLNSLPL
jgi:hypothetical protein